MSNWYFGTDGNTPAEKTDFVTVRIKAVWKDLNEMSLLAQAGPTSYQQNFSSAPKLNTLYPIVLAEMTTSTNMNGDTADIFVEVNGKRTDWYFGTDGNVLAGKADFVTVIMHELMHGFGQGSAMDA